MSDQVVVRFSRVKIIPFAAWAVLGLAGSLSLCLLPEEWAAAATMDYSADFVRMFFGACVVIYGLFAVLLSVLLWRKPVALVIDRQGIIDRSDFVAVGRIDWSEIRRIRTIWIGMRVLLIDLRDPRLLFHRGNAWQRWAQRIRLPFFRGRFLLTSIVLDIGFSDLRRTIGRFLDGARSPKPTTF